MHEIFSRSALLLGTAAIDRLALAKVAVFGIGGVGSYTTEALARSGVGSLVLVDHDCVCLTNINRQLVALHSTMGRAKVQVMGERVLDINPALKLELFQELYTADSAEKLLSPDISYVVDAIDMVSSKIDLILRCNALGIPIISAMGAGNKLDPSRFKIADIYETRVCPLARVMRRELKKHGIKKLTVVYSDEIPLKGEPEAADNIQQPVENSGRRSIPGSLAFVPSAAGLLIASKLVRDLIAGT